MYVLFLDPSTADGGLPFNLACPTFDDGVEEGVFFVSVLPKSSLSSAATSWLFVDPFVFCAVDALFGGRFLVPLVTLSFFVTDVFGFVVVGPFVADGVVGGSGGTGNFGVVIFVFVVVAAVVAAVAAVDTVADGMVG